MSRALWGLAVMLSLPVVAPANDYIKTAQQLRPIIEQTDILILGERHGERESTELLAALADALTQNGRCLSVGLEIDSDQQTVIRRAISGESPLSEIEISPIIDHPAYRKMLAGLRGLKAEGRCLTMVAMDGFSEKKSRDTWMAETVSPYIDQGKVLCLVGRLHAIKKIRWESGKQEPFLAERLVARGYRVGAVMQIWGMGGDGAVSTLTMEDAAGILNPVAAHMPETASEFGDYVIRWK